MPLISQSPTIDELLAAADVDDPQCVTRLVDGLFVQASQAGASDVHFQPTRDGLQVRWRIDGVLQSLGMVPQAIAENVVVRLKVMAKLLTYQSKQPQEGRIAHQDYPLDIRISTFPTVFGEKAVARLLPSREGDYQRVGDLGLEDDACQAVQVALSQTSGMLLIAGPAGSGKTTTAYACLREILSSDASPRHIVSVEDPVEVLIEGVSQSEVEEPAGFDLTSGLRSLVRQDPDVIFVGEIRDPATASIALQAALTGQLVITTFHAPDTATALSRLIDMGVPAYVLTSGINCVLGQQLIRTLCDCSQASDASEQTTASSCQKCHNAGYRGRRLIAELLEINNSSITATVQRTNFDRTELRVAAQAAGMEPLYAQASALVDAGETDAAELTRVFGIRRQDEG